MSNDIVTQLRGGVSALSSIAQTLSNAFPQVIGTLTLANATTTAVTQPGIVANGFPVLTPTNAAAALLERTQGLFLATVTAGAGFVLSTQTGTAQGTEKFAYYIVNPA